MRRAVLIALGALAMVTAALPESSRALAVPGRAARLQSAPAAALTAGNGRAGRWIVDGEGRALIIHGVNMPSKWLPGVYPAALGFDDDDAALLTRLGFNAVRITAERYAVEPTPGNFDAGYVSHLAETVRMLAAHGLMTMVDFHQDEYGPVFFDNGYPDWMTITDGLPNLYQVGFPFQYLANPALNRAYDHLWANDVGSSGRPLQSDDAAILAYVAAGLRNEPGLLGYEIINEPWPGSKYPTCVLPVVGCPIFDRGAFSAYYRRIVPAVRAADPTHMIWYEPLTTFNQGVPTSVVPPDDPNLGFAFHVYNLCAAGDPKPAAGPRPCRAEDALVLKNALAHSGATGNPLLQTEFGATENASTIADQVDQYDDTMTPWMFWSYTHYMVDVTADGSLLPASDANVNWPIVDALTRPYPQLVAGTPTSWSFDPATRVLQLRYRVTRPDGSGAFPAGSETDIAVPARQYANGYGVKVAGGRVVSAPGASVLRVASCAGAVAVSVTVSRSAAQSGSC